ncbi:MAG: transposase [Acidobacteria bacterium]|nr:transposase [Acidobacteriota bacterium]
MPVHITQRGNFRQPVFAREYDYRMFLEFLGRYAVEYRNRVVGYCLMPNHFHLVAIPGQDDGISAMLRALNSKYARTLNERLERQGHVWQARFGSASMSERHYRAALSYVDLNPVRAGLVRDAMLYEWSSARAHAGLVAAPAFLDSVEFSRMYSAEEWGEIMGREEGKEDIAALRKATKLGTICGDAAYVAQMERQYGRRLAIRPPGRPRKELGKAAGVKD